VTLTNDERPEEKPLKAPRRTCAFLAAAGAISGYLVFHPYSMIVYTLTHPHEGRRLFADLQWRELLGSGFSILQPEMLPMALLFTAMGALVGLSFGVVLDKRKRLLFVEVENEKKRVAIDTIHALMVTLSHYLLNANVIIGGKVRHCRKIESNEDIIDSLRIIEEEARKIDVVVGILQRITEIKTTRYAAGDTNALIDISKEIEQQLSSTKDMKSNGL